MYIKNHLITLKSNLNKCKHVKCLIDFIIKTKIIKVLLFVDFVIIKRK